jgi:hypothetical protein
MLQRLAGSEEILPLPDMTRDCSSKITMEIKKSIETSLSKVCRWITNFFFVATRHHRIIFILCSLYK